MEATRARTRLAAERRRVRGDSPMHWAPINFIWYFYKFSFQSQRQAQIFATYYIFHLKIPYVAKIFEPIPMQIILDLV